MDTSELYIGMSKAAVEVQAQHEKSLMDWYVCGTHHEVMEPDGEYYSTPGCPDTSLSGTVIWLPRQDQLQTLSDLSWKDFDVQCQRYNTDTKGQAGICAVMQSRFKKKWHNGEWRKVE